MTARGPAVRVVFVLALGGCGEQSRAPAPATPATPATPAAATPEVPSPAPTPPPPGRLGPARACVTGGVPFAVVRSRVAMTRRSSVTGDRRALDPELWVPRGARCLRPLIVFSHGHHGAPASCGRLCPRLARAGFVVVAPRHEDRDADRIGLQAGERVDDVEWVLAHLRLRFDRRRIGIAGHSFGGVTAGEAASQDRRLEAVVSLAGSAGHGTMAATRAPTLLVAGTRDAIETVQASRASAGAIAPTVPHELMVVPGARHGALIDRCEALGVCARVERFLVRRLVRG